MKSNIIDKWAFIGSISHWLTFSVAASLPKIQIANAELISNVNLGNVDDMWSVQQLGSSVFWDRMTHSPSFKPFGFRYRNWCTAFGNDTVEKPEMENKLSALPLSIYIARVWILKIPHEYPQYDFLSAHDDVIKWKHFPRYWPLCGEFTGPRWIPRTKASDAELWCFLWSAPE